MYQISCTPEVGGGYSTPNFWNVREVCLAQHTITIIVASKVLQCYNTLHVVVTSAPQRKNALSDAAMTKIEMGLFKLNRLSSPYYQFYKKKFKAFKFKRLFKKYLIWFIVAFVLILGNLIVGNF